MTSYRQSMKDTLESMYAVREASLLERDLTPDEEKRREEIAKDLPDDDFKKRYGDKWKSVKMATATKMMKKEEVNLDEDGHTDVSSAVRKCMTITEDAQDINSKLRTMSPEDSLPSWWTNKLAVASNDMNKMRDYIVNPVQEEVDLDEGKMKDLVIKGQDLETYAKKSGGVDKNDMMKVAAMLKKGDKSGAVKYAMKLDTDPKEYILNLIGEETELDEAKMSASQIATLKKAYEPMRGKKISMDSGKKLSSIMDKVDDDKQALIQLVKADIPFVSQSAVTKLITKHNMKGAEINKLREEVGESYEIGTDEYRDHTLEVTPGQSLTWGSANAYKQASMKEALAKVWGLDEKALDKSSKEKYDEEDEELKPVKGSKTMTGGKVAKVEIQPKIDG